MALHSKKKLNPLHPRMLFAKCGWNWPNFKILSSTFVLFVSLRFFIPFKNFSLIWRCYHYRWKAANFDICQHLWPLNNKGSLACHTCCDKGHPFIMVISEDTWHSYLLPSVWQWSCHYLILWLRSVAAGIQTLYLPLARRTPKPTEPLLPFHVLLLYRYYLPLGKGCGPSFDQTYIPFTQGCFVPSLVEIGPEVLEKICVNVFLLLSYYLPLRKGCRPSFEQICILFT